MWLVRVLVVLLLAVAAAYAGTTGSGQSDPRGAFQNPRAFELTPPASVPPAVSKPVPTQRNALPEDGKQGSQPIQIDDIIRALDSMH